MEVKIGIQSVPRELVVETDTPAGRDRAPAGGRAGRRRPFPFHAGDGQGRQDPGARGQNRLRRIRRTRGAPGGLRQHRLTTGVLLAAGLRDGLDRLLVHLVTTGQWNDITKGRVVQSAAVYVLLLRLGVVPGLPGGIPRKRQCPERQRVPWLSPRLTGIAACARVAARVAAGHRGQPAIRRPDPGTAGQGHDEGWNPDNSNI